MNIVLLGHDDIASRIALNLIFTRLPEHRCRLFVAGRLSDGDHPLPKRLERLDRIDQQFCASLPWTAAGESKRLPAPNSEAGLADLAACDPDLFISVRYRRILHAAAIAIPRHGVLNLHSGLLPEYRGVMATFWAMLNGEKDIGCTLHAIVDKTIDTGPIIGRSRNPVRTEWSYLANVLELYPSACRMVTDAVMKISAGEPLGPTAQTGDGHYYSTPRSQDLDRFAARGLHLADPDDLDAFLARHAKY
ncbi:MAG: formyl transferase [Woeseia sp.]